MLQDSSSVLIVTLQLHHLSLPQDVVGDEKPTRGQQGVGLFEGLWILVLVDIVENDIEGPF